MSQREWRESCDYLRKYWIKFTLENSVTRNVLLDQRKTEECLLMVDCVNQMYEKCVTNQRQNAPTRMF
jgi:hypothetical protein